MRIIFGRSLIMIVLAAIAISSPAQKDVKKYKEEADAIRNEVWGWKKPEFAVHEIPAQYTDASKVIIARHTEINADSKKKASFGMFGFGAYRQLYLTEITREVIKLNDKAAVDDYSEISYTQLEKSGGMYSTNTSSVYIGVRVIKPDGTVKEISTDDIVLTTDERSRKEAKLAIPDLQTGDIIDYFLAKQQKMEQEGLADISNYVFAIFDEAPVLFYSIHAETGKKYAVEYRCYNGAPDFKQSTTEDEDNVFDMVIKNIPAYKESGLWISPFRQLPVIRMNVKVGYKGRYSNTLNAREPGKVYANPPADEFIEDEEIRIQNYQSGTSNAGAIINYNLSGNILKYYLQLLKNRKTLPADSVIAELYYLYRYARFLDVAHYTDINSVVNTAKKGFNPNFLLYDFGAMLRQKDLDCNMVFVTPRAGPTLKEILSPSDINWMLLAHTGKDRLIGITDIFSPAFHVPDEYENTRQAMTLNLEKKGGSVSVLGRVADRKRIFDEGVINIPGSSPLENTRIETINAAPSSNGTDLQISRNTILKGHYKSDTQKNLILFEDYCNAERKLLGADNTMIEELEAVKNKKSYAPELKAAFDKARIKQKDEFVDEARAWFEQPITDLTEYKIENMGVRHNNPDFIYSSKFNVGGLIKKAGNNMIVDIGKLQGSPLTVKPSQRKRKLDIYMPFARSLQVQIILQIPDGYTAEGVNELNKKLENETGYFIAEATSDGKTVTVKIRKSYNHAYEPAGNWEKLLAFIDAANEWSNAKILFKKK